MHRFHDYLCQQLDDMLKKRVSSSSMTPDASSSRSSTGSLRRLAPDYDGLPRCS